MSSTIDIWQSVQTILITWLPALAVLAIASGVIKVIGRKSDAKVEGHRFREQMWALLISLSAIVALILALPLSDNMRGQLLTLLGLLLTAIITLSSTTVAANAMAGFMLRSLKNFEPGDFIQVQDYFGRVTELDLFHTEIQTENRDLLTFPNIFLASNPVKVVHAKGTIISAEVSLGYDVDHQRVEHCLLHAAESARLSDAFVHVIALGDFSVVYRVSGFLPEVKQLLSTRSELRKQMMDTLHRNGIEIVSPNFMNQRQVSEAMIPQRRVSTVNTADSDAESIVFDKAEKAQQLKELRESYTELKAELSSIDDADQAEKAKRRIKVMKRAIGMLEKQKDS